jgi:hypothetical protein
MSESEGLILTRLPANDYASNNDTKLNLLKTSVAFDHIAKTTDWMA